VTNIPVIGSVGSGNRATGDVSADSTYRLLAENTSFLLEFTNESAADIFTFLRLIWGELPASEVRDPIIITGI
jgi:hypothetical protein